jgi:DNA-binding NarL/FixJ family response regulator
MQPDAEPIRFLLCDDHRILTDALSVILETEPDFEMVAPPVVTGEEAIELVSHHHPDLVLMDISLRGSIDGIDTTRRIKEASPDTRVLIMSGQPEEDYLLEAVEAGASGFITKGEDIEFVMSKMRAVAAGDMLVNPARLSRLLQAAAKTRASHAETEVVRGRLTPRELEVLELIAGGLSNDDIAHKLTISLLTAQTHVRNILSKLDCHSKLEAATLAVKHGIVTL